MRWLSTVKDNCTSLEHSFQLFPERLVHESVDDRVGHVVDKMHVKYDDLERYEASRHEPRWQKADDEHKGDHEKHDGCANVRQEIKISPLPMGFLLRVRGKLGCLQTVFIRKVLRLVCGGHF